MGFKHNPIYNWYFWGAPLFILEGMIHRQKTPSLTAARPLQVTPLTGGAWADLVLLPAEAKFSMEA